MSSNGANPSFLRRMRKRAGRLYSILLSKIKGAHLPPYSTHVPVLLAVSRLHKIRRVVEFGAGKYSTLTFLNKQSFPDLESFVSYENHLGWAESMRLLVQDDPRCTLHYIDQPMSVAAQAVDLGGVDLIFIDSQTMSDRAITIKSVLDRYVGRGVVVLHDIEQRPYQEASANAPHLFRFRAYIPQTGVVWFAPDTLNPTDLNRFHDLMRQHAKLIEPEDIAGWEALYDRVLGKRMA